MIMLSSFLEQAIPHLFREAILWTKGSVFSSIPTLVALSSFSSVFTQFIKQVFCQIKIYLSDNGREDRKYFVSQDFKRSHAFNLDFKKLQCYTQLETQEKCKNKIFSLLIKKNRKPPKYYFNDCFSFPHRCVLFKKQKQFSNVNHCEEKRKIKWELLGLK